MTALMRHRPRAVWKATAVLCAVALTLIGSAGPANATDTKQAGAAQPSAVAVFRIINAYSGLCLTIAGGTSAPNAHAVQYNCDNHRSRFWKFVTGGNAGGHHHIVNMNSGLCLTIAGGSSQLNAVAVQYSCDTHSSRRWTVAPTNDGRFQFINARSGWCLTIAGGSTALNAAAVQYQCDGHFSRYWHLTFAWEE